MNKLSVYAISRNQPEGYCPILHFGHSQQAVTTYRSTDCFKTSVLLCNLKCNSHCIKFVSSVQEQH